MKKVVVFGGNGCKKEKEEYYFSLAHQIGKLLAKAKFITITGAGRGMMDETSRGAHEAGGEVHGVGLNLEGRVHSQYVKRLEVFDKLGPRQEKLIELADAFIALPGGIGTLHEINHILALKRIGEIPQDKPLVLLGEYFQPLVTLFKEVIAEGFVSADLDSLYFCAKNPEEAIKYIQTHIHD